LVQCNHKLLVTIYYIKKIKGFVADLSPHAVLIPLATSMYHILPTMIYLKSAWYTSMIRLRWV